MKGGKAEKRVKGEKVCYSNFTISSNHISNNLFLILSNSACVYRKEHYSSKSKWMNVAYT